MSKVIILVEDKIYKLNSVLNNIQNTLFSASVNKLKNAPMDNDTEIYVCHILWKTNSSNDEMLNDNAGEKIFNEYKDELIKKEDELRKDGYSVPKLNYSYKEIIINNDDYTKNCELCSDCVHKEIEIIYNQYDNYAIILDVILNVESDTQRFLNGNLPILSQLLYSKFINKCISYTNYDNGGVNFRQKWIKEVLIDKPLFERNSITGNAIHKKLKEELYKILNIGGEQNE